MHIYVAAFSFPPLDHTTLGDRYDLFGLEDAARVTGSRWYYLKREAAMLEMALVVRSMGMGML